MGGRAGDGGMRWRESGRQGGREGGNGVTLTEPVVDKTLRQIRRSRVWSLFCFPLLLLSGGISLLLLSDIPSLFLSTFNFFFFSRRNHFVKLFSSAPRPHLLVQTKIFLLLSGMCSKAVPGLRHLFSSRFLIVFLLSLMAFREREEPAFD